MDNDILDLVIGLVLIYAVVALLVTSLQEAIDGTLFKGRSVVLYRMLLEACGRSRDLRERVLANPLVFALSAGDKPADPDSWLARGPSEIPPDVFARALLMELDPASGGRPPSDSHATPSAFLDALDGNQDDSDATRIRKTLRGLAVGHEGDWTGFENAIAAWFSLIGDRANGWFRRRSAKATFLIGFAVAASLNLDSLNIVERLASEPEARAALANLGERVAAEREGKPDPRPATGSAQAPEARLSASLTDAYNRLRPAFMQDKDIAQLQYRLGDVKTYCAIPGYIAKGERGGSANDGPKKDGDPNATEADKLASAYLSEPKSWLEVIPFAVLPAVEVALGHYPSPVSGRTTDKPANESETYTTLRHAHACLAHISAWVRAARTVSKSEDVRRAMGEAAGFLEEAKAALITLIGQERPNQRLARLFARNPELFAECARSESSLAAIRDCMGDRGNLLASLPIGWTPTNKAAQFCKVAVGPLPGATERGTEIGLTQITRCEQVCRKSCEAPAAAVALAKAEGNTPDSGQSCQQCVTECSRTAYRPVTVSLDPAKPQPDGWLCTAKVDERAEIGLRSMAMQSSGSLNWLRVLAGLVLTTAFIALGAPFWFDVLSRVVKLRAAGRLRADEETAAKGTGNAPLPSIATPPADGSGGGGAAAAKSSDAPAGMAAGLNDFESQLTRREIAALQVRLGVAPSSVLDRETRIALNKWQNDNGYTPLLDQLTPTLYEAIMQRPAIAGASSAASAGTRLRAGGTLGGGASGLGATLATLLDFDFRSGAGSAGRFDADLRALVVLYRLKKERAAALAAASGLAPRDCDLALPRLAENAPASLDEIDDELNRELLGYQGTSVLPTTTVGSPPAAPASALAARHLRDEAPWLDWAYGELGQVERNRHTRDASNPRICEYLDAVAPGFGDHGDATAWCGAFVTWVLTRFNAEVAAAGGSLMLAGASRAFAALPAPPASPGLANSWAQWQDAGSPPELARRTNATDRKRGDIVVVSVGENRHHVGFYVGDNGGRVVLLGGNQGDDRVKLSAFPAGAIECVNNPLWRQS
ncbi:C40 family peptidase [Derxia lacustris]|uniref:hypothetical protein n=1 Tax=Derxia lacustris TaxID=764842 RepID=UPI000A1721E2|nr:hypothetical protein [Derxia lacustris]